ncbi:flagellar biosynthetic protein FliO [Thermodesulfobacteriota bacterium]
METEFGGAFIKMLGALLFVLGLILLLIYLFKRFRLNSFALAPYSQMRLIGTLNLAPKRALALVEIMDQWVLIGIGTENITLISKLDRPLESHAGAEGAPEKKAGFLSLLQEKRLAHRKKTSNRRNGEIS